ncbi:MAG: SRPBCC family protein [Actinomycetota bacterium]
MTLLRRTVDLPKPLEEAFAYLGDFSTTAAWDPGIDSAAKVTEGPIGVGTVFDLVARFNERVLPMSYTITEWEPNRRVVLEGSGSTVLATDEMVFEAIPGGTRLHYSADLRLRGLLRIFTPLMRARFERLADDAMAGLRRTLA